MDILGISYLGFETPNAKEWREFGSEILGLGQAHSDDEETVLLRMDDRRWRIALHPGETDQLAYIGWELRSKPSWQAAIKTLRDYGTEVTIAEPELAERRGVREVAQFTDPSGYHHELIYGQRVDPGSFVPGRAHRGFVAGRDGVGHVVLVVPEFSESLDLFWQDVMGFEWFGAGAGPGPAGFYRAKLNGLTHNIGLIEAPGLFGFHHIGMPVRDVDDVGIALDLCREREIPLQKALGRHTQDPVISFYTFTPSGFIIEYLSPIIDNDPETFYETNPERLSVWGHEMVGPPLPSTVRLIGAG